MGELRALHQTSQLHRKSLRAKKMGVKRKKETKRDQKKEKKRGEGGRGA